MTYAVIKKLSLLAFLGLTVFGCRTVATEQDRAARIVAPDDASRAALQRAVNGALHTEVTLADDALTESSVLIIERSPPQTMDGLPTRGRTTEEPLQLRLVINRGRCILIDQRDHSRHELEHTRCEAE